MIDIIFYGAFVVAMLTVATTMVREYGRRRYNAGKYDGFQLGREPSPGSMTTVFTVSVGTHRRKSTMVSGRSASIEYDPMTEYRIEGELHDALVAKMGEVP